MSLLSALLLVPVAATLQVGPTRTYTTVKAAHDAASAGSVIEIDAGEYVMDGFKVTKSDLTFRGVGGRPHLRALAPDTAACAAKGGGAQSVTNGKGLFVIENPAVENTTLENLEISGVTICDGDGKNGAAIRMQAKNLTVRGCFLHDNQNGLLANGPDDSTILVEHSELARNGVPASGYEHNLYVVGGKLVFRYNYSHHAYEGHLLKSKALETHVLYNRLSDEGTGDSSALIDLSYGGKAYVVGNLLHKGPATSQTGRAIWYKFEATTHAPLELYVVNNTYVNDWNGTQTVFVHAKLAKTVVIANNIVLGKGASVLTLDAQEAGASVTLRSNIVDPAHLTLASFAGSATPPAGLTYVEQDNQRVSGAGLVDRAAFDWRLAAGSPAIDAGYDLGGDVMLVPSEHYVHPAASEARPAVGGLDVGAFEYGLPDADDGAPMDDGAPTDDGGPVDDGAPADPDSGGDAASPPPDDDAPPGGGAVSGSCAAAAPSLAALLLALLALRRRR